MIEIKTVKDLKTALDEYYGLDDDKVVVAVRTATQAYTVDSCSIFRIQEEGDDCTIYIQLADGKYVGERKAKPKETMTSELAQRIQDAFGSCSVMYETQTIEEIIADYNESGSNLREWLKDQIKFEKLYLERQGDCSEDGRSRKQQAEDRAFIAEITARVKEIKY